MKPTRTTSTLLVCSVLLATVVPAFAQFRSFTPIASPEHEAKAIPDGTVPVEKVIPVPRALVEPKLEAIIDKWNTPQMADTLAEEFFDRSRLLDTVNTEVPRDAKLRFQSLQSVQTLQQYRVPSATPLVSERVSLVSATARTQLEFNDGNGLVRVPGTNEYILKITQPEFGR